VTTEEIMTKFREGQRVRTTVNAPAAWPGAFSAPAGTRGTIDHVFAIGYGVVLDGDPDRLSAYYGGGDLEAI
jgi:hypothetical protein